jgi:ribosome recycling factor
MKEQLLAIGRNGYMADKIYNDAETRMKKAISTLSHDLAKVRTGRAHPSLLDGLTVLYYDVATPINQLASIVVEDPRTLMITPFDKASVNLIDKAIRTSELGLNPATAGQVIRIPLPPLTEERRIALVKQIKGEAEKARVAIRNIRRDANQHVKDLLKAKTIGEDEERRAEEKVQKLTDKYIAEVDKLTAAKEADLMKV